MKYSQKGKLGLWKRWI